MADSIRKQIVDEVVSILGLSTGITTVKDYLHNPFEFNSHDFPVVSVLDQDTDIDRWTYRSSGDDKEAVLQLLIRGFVHDQNNQTSRKRTNLIRDIQQSLQTGSTGLTALIFDIEDRSIETDDGILDNYSVFDIMYNITYHYNHDTP
jgi:hypothetical protein